MRNRNSYNKEPALKSYCDDMLVRGTARQIQERWEVLSDEADKVGDRVSSQRFLQQAEHYLKINTKTSCI